MHERMGRRVGLVAARHLFHFGYKPKVYWPKQSSKELFQGLDRQLKQLGIGRVKDEKELEEAVMNTDVIIDAIFGKWEMKGRETREREKGKKRRKEKKRED